jgi:hypothetical protein
MLLISNKNILIILMLNVVEKRSERIRQLRVKPDNNMAFIFRFILSGQGKFVTIKNICNKCSLSIPYSTGDEVTHSPCLSCQSESVNSNFAGNSFQSQFPTKLIKFTGLGNEVD